MHVCLLDPTLQCVSDRKVCVSLTLHPVASPSALQARGVATKLQADIEAAMQREFDSAMAETSSAVLALLVVWEQAALAAQATARDDRVKAAALASELSEMQSRVARM